MKKTEFDPFQWAKEDYCEAPLENPGDLIGSMVRQGGQVIKESKDDKDLQETALGVMNLAASLITQSEWAEPDLKLTDDQAKSIRETIVRAYVLGTQATRLALITSDPDTTAARKHLEQVVISDLGRKAAQARHRPTQNAKQRALDEWDNTGHQYSNMTAFSELKCKEYSVKQRTLYEWIREHQKNKP